MHTRKGCALEGNSSTNHIVKEFTDEFVLFFQAVPNKNLKLNRGKCTDVKHSKVRLIRISAASAAGEKLLVLVIGNSKNPRCFKSPCHVSTEDS